MAPEDITIQVSLNRGTAVETVWTTDLYEYVRINVNTVLIPVLLRLLS